MSSVVALAVIAVALGLWFIVRKRAPDKALSPASTQIVTTIDAVAAGFLEGRSVSDEDLAACGAAMQSLYRDLCRSEGTDDNTKFSPQNRARFYLSAIKVAALDHPDHNAWPLMSSLRRRVLETLLARLEREQDAWTRLALITPALLSRDVELAATLYRELPARLARVAEAWVLESAIGYADFNDAPSSLRFLEQVKAPTAPALPEDDALDAARRWAISVAVHPSYARDPRAALEDPLPAPVCRLALERWWDVTDTESALNTLSWLQEAGHREELAEALEEEDGEDERSSFVAETADALEAHMILAWDLCRLVQVARTSAKAGYVSEVQAWTFILSAARALQQEYASWDEMGEDYLLGNRFFASGGDPEPTHRASVEWLQRASESPWRNVPWDLALD